jgi:hypothetical protein
MSTPLSQPMAGVQPRPGHRLLIWTSLWGGGVAWLLHLAAAWILSEFGCLGRLAQPGPRDISWVAWSILGVTVLCLALGAFSVWTSYLCAREPAAIPQTTRLVSRYGLAANPIFMLIITTQAIPVFYYLRDCGTYIIR